MKKIVKYIALIFAISILGIGEVNAYEVGDYFAKTTNHFNANPIKFATAKNNSGNAATFGDYHYVASAEGDAHDGVTHDIFCIDPGAADNEDLVAKRILLGGGSPEAEDYGMLIIVTADKDEYADLSEAEFYLARSVALRVYINGYLQWSNSASASGRVTDLKTQSKTWVAGSGSAGLVANGETNATSATKIMTAAKKMFDAARTARSNYTSIQLPEVAQPVIEHRNKVEDEEPDTPDFSIPTIPEEDEGDGTVSATYEYVVKFQLKNFTNEGSFIWASPSDNRDNVDFDYTYEVIGATTENSQDMEDFTTRLYDGVNLLDVFASEASTHGEYRDLTFYVGIRITATFNEDELEEEGGDCTAKLKLNYKYSDESLYHGVVLYGRNPSGVFVTDEQRFIFGTKDPVAGSADITFSVCDTTDSCAPVGMIPYLCEDDAETVPIDGDTYGNVNSLYVYREAFDEDSGKYDIKKCLLKNNPTDVAGNSLKLRDNANANTVSNNPYCSITCKEDYRFEVPYKRQVTPGRYFTIGVDISAQQDCYSTEFRYEKYQTDLKNALEALVDKYNEWAKYYELINSDLTTTTCSEDEQLKCNIVECVGDVEDEGTCKMDSYDEDLGESHKLTSGVCEQTLEFGQGVEYYVVNDDLSIVASESAKPEDVTFGFIGAKNRGSCESEADDEGNCTYEGEDISVPSPYTSCPFGWERDDDDNCTSEIDQPLCEAMEPEDHRDHLINDKILGFRDQNVEGGSYLEQMNAAADEIPALVQNVYKIIDSFNFCTGDDNYEAYYENYQGGDNSWELVYKFDPEVAYFYEEPDPTKSSGTGAANWISFAQQYQCEDTTCNYMVTKEFMIEAEDCGDLSDEQCTDGLTTVKGIHPTTEGEDDYPDLEVNTYCKTGINDDYTCADESETLHSISEDEYAEKQVWVCDVEEQTIEGETHNILNCDYEDYLETEIRYVHKLAVAKAKLDTPRVYYSIHDDGNIEVSTSGAPENGTLVPGLPVSPNTPENTYPYFLIFENIGTFYNDNSLGRIYSGEPTSIANWKKTNATNSFTDEDAKTTVTVPLGEGQSREVEIEANQYACVYSTFNSCQADDGTYYTYDDCEFDEDTQTWEQCKEELCGKPDDGPGYCIKEAESYYVCENTFYSEETCTPVSSREEAISQVGEENNYNCCPNCRVICVGSCLYVLHNDYDNDGELLMDFRTISTTNINPNNREDIGFNWQTNNPTNSLAGLKAGMTISEIEARANKDVETTDPDFEEVNDDYEMRVKMTPEMITFIKEYNNSHIDDGSYNNDSLTCYDFDLSQHGYTYENENDCEAAGYSWQDDKCVMSNIFCYSTFIDELIEEFNQGGETLIEADGREESKNAALYNSTISSSLITSEVEDIWTNDYWTIYKFSSIDVNNDGRPDIGPSWK